MGYNALVARALANSVSRKLSHVVLAMILSYA